VTAAPRLSVGLPVYNGEKYLGESLDALLGQTYEDFELVISDNASTDDTEEICRRYARQDSRIRYYRQPENIGLSPNHNFVLDQARGELFKWASDDDLYARDLLKLCVEILDEKPAVVCAHSWTALIDESAAVIGAGRYPLATASAHAPERFRSVLFDEGGDDDGGVIRTAVLRAIPRLASYHQADRSIIAELALQGPFDHVPDWLYFRRDHPGRAENACPTVRSRCTNMDPRRSSRFRHPAVRLYGEYVWAMAGAIHRAPVPPSDKRECYGYLREWLANRVTGRVFTGHLYQLAPYPEATEGHGISIEDRVAGQPARRS
jgi:glycosyltransferase involved in cell wall biosynthesis